MLSDYSALAKYYDRLGYHIDYKKYASFADSLNIAYGEGKSGIALDLCCGTGALSGFLKELGYDVIGVDRSAYMLDEARKKQGSDILFICQDMRELDLYGTVDLCVCALDSLNYLTEKKELEAVLRLVHNFLEPGGVFVFDVNTKRKFEEIYGNNSYIFEDGNVFCAWQNFYNKKTGICDFYLSIFEKKKDGSYTRQDECHTEKYYSERVLASAMKESGFELIGLYSDCDMQSAVISDETRLFYAAKAIK